MSDAIADKLSNEKIQQLLGAVGAESAEDAKQNVEAFDHDWRQPRYFSRNQLNELKYFAKNVAAAASAKFARFYQGDYDVTTDSMSQHFANEFDHQTSDSKNFDYYLVFGIGQAQDAADIQPCGVVGIPHETAIAWATQSLGDTKSEEDAERDLSQLEKSLLQDIASLFVEALSDSYDNQYLHALGGIVAGQFPLDLENTKELCKITFNTKGAGAQESTKAYVLMLCDKLEPITKIVTQTTGALSAEDISKAIIGHLHQMEASVTVRLGSSNLTFEEFMSLRASDVLMLDERVGEPIRLIAEGLELFRGKPAKSMGMYAVAITQTSFENTG